MPCISEQKKKEMKGWLRKWDRGCFFGFFSCWQSKYKWKTFTQRMKAGITCTGTLWESIGIGTSSEYFEEMSRFSWWKSLFQELRTQSHTLAGTLSLTALWLSYTGFENSRVLGKFRQTFLFERVLQLQKERKEKSNSFSLNHQAQLLFLSFVLKVVGWADCSWNSNDVLRIASNLLCEQDLLGRTSEGSRAHKVSLDWNFVCLLSLCSCVKNAAECVILTL